MVTPPDHICWGGGHHHQGGHTLIVHQLSAGYQGELALENISFQAHCGHTLALIGPNGAGKSTLLNVLAGLLLPMKGQILWNKAPLTAQRREIAYMPQRSEVDWKFPITVRKLVSMGRFPMLGLWKKPTQHDHDIVERALEALHLQDLQHKQIGELSGGQQQRAFLARAVAQEAHILLLDEPFTGLDVPGMHALANLLRDLAREGRLIIASHHHLESAGQIFDTTLLLNKQALAYGSSQDVLTPPLLQKTFGFSALYTP